MSVSGRDKVVEVLERYFKYTTLRPGQYEAVQAVVEHMDVFVKMRTGSGKSLCMFRPPLCLSDIKAAAVIVSPLTGLMEQQVCVFTGS